MGCGEFPFSVMFQERILLFKIFAFEFHTTESVEINILMWSVGTEQRHLQDNTLRTTVPGDGC